MRRRYVLAAGLAAAFAVATPGACNHTNATTTGSAKQANIAGNTTAGRSGAMDGSTASDLLPHSVPRYGHIVVVVMENRGFADVIGNPQAPYLNSLSEQGVSLTRSYAVAHPSEPNYLALFSGSTHGLTSDACLAPLSSPNLASELSASGYTFTGYSESLPQAGYTGCGVGGYVRKHNPWVDFTNLAPAINQPFAAFPRNYNQLPTVSFVIPNLNHDMHDGTINQGDQWLQDHLSSYAGWTYGHQSLLIVTWDENDGARANHIPTILVGAGLLSRTDSTPSTHYTLLRMIEDCYGLPLLGASATAPSLTADWR